MCRHRGPAPSAGHPCVCFPQSAARCAASWARLQSMGWIRTDKRACVRRTFVSQTELSRWPRRFLVRTARHTIHPTRRLPNGKESWSVDYHVLEGQTSEGAVWQKFATVLDIDYPTESGAALPIVRFAIDSGYETPEVYAWTRTRGDERAVLIKGDSRAAEPVSQSSAIDVGPQGNRVRWGKQWAKKIARSSSAETHDPVEICACDRAAA
jgi:hypothetical protein